MCGKEDIVINYTLFFLPHLTKRISYGLSSQIANYYTKCGVINIKSHSFSNYLLNTYYVSFIFLGAGNIAMDKTGNIPTLRELIF